MVLSRCLFGLILVLAVAGCATPAEPPAPMGPPEGWLAEGDRWWMPGVDTARAFRNLESLQTMGVMGEDLVFGANLPAEMQRTLVARQLGRAVEQSLIRIIRNEPEVVDSLFERYVFPKIAGARLGDDLQKEVSRFKREGYKILRQHFLEPRTLLHLGTDIPVPYPDSLRTHGVKGKVQVQAYLDAEGRPVAVQLLEGVHPVLDVIGMRATTEMRWQPAYLLRGGKSRPFPSWTRFRVNFMGAAR